MASDATENLTGTYTLSVRDITPPPDDSANPPDDPPDDSADPPEGGFREGDTDLPANDDTTGVVEVDGFGARGAIAKPVFTESDRPGYDFDTDWFPVELEADRTYRIDMKGAILTSPGTYADDELTLRLPQINAIYDADGGFLFNTWSRDESSAHHLFRVTFHAHAGGTYYIAASGESFSYQWLADDAEIAGATGLTYTLSAADEGKVVKVRVSFTDDADNDETLTSGATDAVAAPESPAKPTGLSATATHDSVTLTLDDPNDDSITGYVILRRPRYDDPEGHFDELVADTGTAATTYTDDRVKANTSYTYRIKAINEYGVSERSRWFHIDTPAAPEPAN